MNLPSSTKFRLTLWYVGVLTLILTLFAVAAYSLFAAALRSQVDSTLAEIAVSFEDTVKREIKDEAAARVPEAVEEVIRDSAEEINFRNYKIFVYSADKALLSQIKPADSGARASDDTAREWLGDFVDRADVKIKDISDGEEFFRVYFQPFQFQGEVFYLLVAHPLKDRESLLENVRYALFVSVPLALLFASFGGYLLASKSLRPIAEISGKAEEIHARNLHERLPVQNKDDELGRLAAAFNRMLARLDAAFEQQQRFMADASHELRTPVAIVRGEADVSLSKTEREPAEYRETIQIIQKEAERMSAIIEDLFTLSRADAGENSVRKSLIYLEDVLADVVKSFRSLAAKRGLDLGNDFRSEMPMQADEQLLKRLFINLLDNAVKHAKRSIVITARELNGNYSIEFEDDGEGIPAENRTQVFERFYRVDEARSRQKQSAIGSGAGLGLSISKWITEIHDGTLEITKSDETGSKFTVTFPSNK